MTSDPAAPVQRRDFLQLGVTNALVRPGGVTMLGSPADLSLLDRCDVSGTYVYDR